MLSDGFKIIPSFSQKLDPYFTGESGSYGRVVKGLMKG